MGQGLRIMVLKEVQLSPGHGHLDQGRHLPEGILPHLQDQFITDKVDQEGRGMGCQEGRMGPLDGQELQVRRRRLDGVVARIGITILGSRKDTRRPPGVLIQPRVWASRCCSTCHQRRTE